MLSDIIRRFSFLSIDKASVTWNNEDLPTKQTDVALEFIKVLSPGSLAALLLGLLVMPKAVKDELLNFISLLKNSSSVGFAPGQPPSI